jgi:RimJ/RimL family protein N-acetyltransferase
MSGLELLPATDAHFAWLLGEAGAPDGLRAPPCGVDQPWVYRWRRRTLPRLGGRGSWLMAADGEIVGLCGYKGPPNVEGDVEIGYAVAPERRRRGHATRAVTLAVEAARLDERVRAVVAETAIANLPSQKVLAANGFAPAGHGMDEDEGETIVWRLELKVLPGALQLVPATEAHFAWMLDEGPPPDAFCVPEGGVDTPYGVRWQRAQLPAPWEAINWLMVDAGEIVGFCLFKRPPQDGQVEIGYRVAEARRRRGYATEATRLMLLAARSDPRVSAVTAETVAANWPSRRVLEANGFEPVSEFFREGDGALVLWRRDV